MQPRTLSIGGATYDLFIRTGKSLACTREGTCSLLLPLGDKIRVDQVIETCGGGAANTAVGLSRLGCRAAFSGVVGSDQWGERILETLRKEGVNTEPATVVDGETTSFSIILSIESGDRVILYSPGTNVHLQDATFDRERASKMDFIYLNHLSDTACMIEDDLIELLQRQEGTVFAWNPGGNQIAKGIGDACHRQLLRKTGLMLLNKDEAFTFTATADIPSALRAIADAGASIACITDGSRGAFGSDGKRILHCPCDPSAVIVDTTGAGDAFGTGAAWALLRGLDLREILHAGTLNASSVVSAVGAQAGLLTAEELERRLAASPLRADQTPL